MEEVRIGHVMIGNWIDVRSEAAPDIPHYERVTPPLLLRNEIWYGISLTKEILEKNGFAYIEKDEDYTHFYPGERCYCSNMSMHIGTNNNGVFWVNYRSDSIYHIRYVHELQVALTVVGYDKDIIL